MKQTVTNKKRLILTATKLGVSLLLLYWVLRKTNLAEIFTAVRSTSIPLLMAALSIYFVSYYIRAHRWRVLLKAQGVNASVSFLLKSYMVGIFFSNFLPSTIGGDAVRVYDIWRLGASKSGAVATVVVDRFLGLVGLILFAIGAMLVSEQLSTHLWLLYPWLLLGAVVMLLGFWMLSMLSKQMSMLIPKIRVPLAQKLHNKLSNILTAFLTFKNRKYALAVSLGLSLIVQITVVVHYYLIAKSLDLSVSFESFFLVIPPVTLIMALPVSINAIGLRENAFVFFFGAYGYRVSRPEAVAFAWLAYGIVIIQGLVGGIVYALRK